MKITIELSELAAMIADFVQIGYMEGVRAYEPSRDLVRKSELKPWLRMMNVDERRFDSIVKAGMVTPRRKGKSVNSPIFYSKKEIKQALATDKVNAIVRGMQDEN